MNFRASLIFSSIEKYSTSIISFVLALAAARLFTPDEMGAVTVGLSVLMLAEIFRDFGASNYLIQEHNITPEGVRTTITINLIASTSIAVAIWAAAGAVAKFYERAGLELFLSVATISFLLGSVTSPINALLRREMAFNKVALIGVSGALVNLVTTVGLATLGYGFLSFAWASLLSSAVSVPIALAVRPPLWSMRPTLTEWRKIVAFGGYSTGTVLVNQAYQMLPQLFLGRVLGLDSLGLYSRALWLCQLPERTLLSGLQPVILPMMAREVRGGGDLKALYLRGIAYLTVFQWPFILCLALLADPIVQLLLGSQWKPVAPLVRIMALAWLFSFAAVLTYPVMVALGRIQDTLTSSLISLSASTLVIIVVAQFGLEAVAASLFITIPLQVYVAFRFIQRYVPITWADIAGATWKSALITLCAAAGPLCAIILNGFRFDLSIPTMLAATAGSAIAWSGAVRVLNHPLRSELSGALRGLVRLAQRAASELLRRRVPPRPI